MEAELTVFGELFVIGYPHGEIRFSNPPVGRTAPPACVPVGHRQCGRR